MRKTITLFLVSLFMVGSAFAQNRVVPEGRKYKEVEHLKKQKTVVFENKDIQSKDGVLEVEGFEDVTETWPGGWETASSSDLTGANWTATDFMSGDNTWFVCTPESFQGDGGEYIYEGQRSAAIGYSAGQSGNSMHWLVSKEVELPTDTAFLSFMTWFTSSTADGWFTYFHVQIEVDGTWENLLSWNTNDESNNNEWESVVDIDLMDYLGETVRFGFVFEYNDGFQMALDSIAYMNVPPADDAGINKIQTPASGTYEAGNIDVEVQLKNYGADTLTAVDINWGVETGGDFNLVSTEAWTGELPQGSTETVAVGNYDFSDYGTYKIIAFTSAPNGAEDINTANDSASVSFNIYEPGQLFEDYEEGDFAMGWVAEGDWMVSDYQPYAGMYHAELGHDSYSPEYKMITPKVHIDGTIPEISFYAGGLNNTAGYGSSKLQLMYSVDGEDWEAFGPEIDFAETGDAYQKYTVDLEIPAGDYHIAFSATSDFYYYGMYYSYIFIDNITGPFLAAPQPVVVVPEDGETGVALDAFIGALFDQAIDSADFSGITIVGENEGEVGNVVAEVDPVFPAMNIYHDPFTGNGEEYTVTIPAGTVTNGAGFNEEITWTFTTILAAPEVEVLSPAHEAEGVALDAEVSVVFNQQITDANLAGITMEGSLQGAVTGVNAMVNPDGKTVVISHDNFTTFEDTITVTMPAGAVENEDGVTNNEITWEFYLMQEGQPVADSLAPANNEAGVALDADVLIRFDTEVAEGDLSGVTIEGATQGVVTNVVATLTDSTIHIAHDAFANNNELYTVTIPAGAVTSVATAEPNAEIKWNFTTIKTAPQVVEMIPADGATKVALDQEVIFSFDQEVMTDYDLDTLITIVGENEDEVEIIGWPQTSDDNGFILVHNGMLYNNAQYTVTVPAGIIYNSDGVMNAEEVSWTFTTIMATPEAETLTPENGAVDVALDASLSVVFDQEVMVNDLGAVKIESEANGLVSNVMATLQDDNKTVIIEHDRFFDTNDDTYYVTIPARSVKNADELYNEKIMWEFNTVETHDVTFYVQAGDSYLEDVTINFGGMTVTTDVDGMAFFDGVAVGTDLPYVAEKAGYETLEGTVDVSQPMTLVLTMAESYKVTFAVTDGAAALADAEVIFNSETKVTDSEGKAVFENVEPGENLVYLVSKDQYESKYGTLDVSSDLVKNVVLDQVTGINKLAEYGIKLYPVPASDYININNLTMPGSKKVEIIDVTGKVVYNRTLENVNNNINVSDFAKGIYFIRITIDNDVIDAKISVQ
ncbi:MAG: Ig-like domain-containing protein [Bacteroidales bacterium]|jgi:hypothetical protein|nr:Ig-like domain-containing protein [Bacteroidales bacterium]